MSRWAHGPAVSSAEVSARVASTDAPRAVAADKYRAPPPALLCAHGSAVDCGWRALRRLAAASALAYGARAALSVGVLAARGRLTRGALGAAVTSGDAARLAAFMGAMVGLQAGVHCALRRLRGVDDKLNAAVAGAVGGAAMLLDAPGRHHLVALLVLVRAADACVRAAAERGAAAGGPVQRSLPRLEHAQATLFGMCVDARGRCAAADDVPLVTA